MIIAHDRLREVGYRIVIAAGSPAADARIVIDHLVDSNLAGHDSHGIGMLPIYMNNFHAGLLHVQAHAEVARDDGAIMIVDGRSGYGQIVAREATEWAIARAAETGICAQSLIHAHHIGRVGTYGEMTAAAGLVSIHFVNVAGHRGLVAPHRGTDSRLATNPICIAVPSMNARPPTILDFATSKIALGKTRVAWMKGEKLTDDMLIDEEGRLSDDPGLMWPEQHAALLPLAEHKGYGLALMCEIFGAALGGAPTIQPGNPRSTMINNNMLSIVMDPARFGTQDTLASEVEALFDYVTASPPRNPSEPVLIPGDPERLSREERLETGIPVDENTWDAIVAAGDSVGISHSELNGLVA